MPGFWQSIRISLLDMRGDMRRFVLLIACLAVGTALIAGVSSVGASIRQAVERDAALLMGGDIELSRADRQATPDELALIQSYGQVSLCGRHQCPRRSQREGGLRRPHRSR